MRTKHGCDLFGATPLAQALPKLHMLRNFFCSCHFLCSVRGTQSFCAKKNSQCSSTGWAAVVILPFAIALFLSLCSVLLSAAASHPLSPIRVVSTHAYTLKLTPTCTRAHVHSVCFSAVELVIAAVLFVTISSVHPFTTNMPAPAVLLVWLSPSSVGDFNPCYLPHS